jgi:aspartyl-tRNA(Asn)/glutamyl-tRNA(Gln) amidotransferase subunit B
MGYQITQYQSSIITGGYVEIEQNGETERIGIERANLEADAGKNTHPAGADYSLVDFNRAGTPLLEIVSQPDMHSAAEAKAYARELWLTMKYAGVTEGNLYHGHVRFDVNTSLSAEEGKLGTRSEVKNLNSFRSVEGAVNYEIKRQTELLEKGEKVIQETRGWDEAKQQTTPQRGKEEAHDYRYMPEPDIPPLELDDKFITDQQAKMPPLPAEIRKILNKSSISWDIIEDILDNQAACDKVLTAINSHASPEIIQRIAYDSLETPETLSVSVQDHIKIAESFKANILSSTTATLALASLAANPSQDVDELIIKNTQVSDKGEIEKIVAEVLAENQKAAADVKNGEMKAIGFLVGQVMAKSQGKANPGLAQQLIKKQLGV